MIIYHWFRFPALVVIVGFAAVCSIAVGGAAINIGQSMGRNPNPPMGQFNDWNADWQWMPAGLVSTYSAAFQRSAHSTLSIAYHAASRSIHREAQRRTLYADTGHIATEKNRYSHPDGPTPKAATQLYIQF